VSSTVCFLNEIGELFVSLFGQCSMLSDIVLISHNDEFNENCHTLRFSFCNFGFEIKYFDFNEKIYSISFLIYLENPNEKRVYAVADGQYTYGPLSLFQFHNDEKYSKL